MPVFMSQRQATDSPAVSKRLLSGRMETLTIAPTGGLANFINSLPLVKSHSLAIGSEGLCHGYLLPPEALTAYLRSALIVRAPIHLSSLANVMTLPVSKS